MFTKTPSSKDRLIVGCMGLVLSLSMIIGVLLTQNGVIHAASATLPSTHRMAVNPLYHYAGKSSGSDFLFSCQEPGASLGCYTPQELLNAYDIARVQNAGIEGQGETIVIIDAFGYPTLAQDVAVFDSTFGLPALQLTTLAPFGQVPFDITNQDEINWSGEIALDVESAHAVAPQATIDLVIARTDQDQDIQNALAYAVNNRLGDVISQSYSEAESCVDPAIMTAQHASFVEAAKEGISVFAASGDDGAALPGCDGSTFIQSVGSPASDPLVTSVGGTSLDATQPDGTYVGETAWNNDEGASGGGFSKLYSRPAYQFGYNSNRGRGVPDVAYSGDVNEGLLIAWSQGDPGSVGNIFVFGGTSAGSPQWAAMLSLVDQVFGPQGDINPLLYLVVAPLEYSRVFHDVTSGNNTVTEEDSSGNPVTIQGFTAKKGWDAVTGLGSLDLGNALLGPARNAWTSQTLP